MLNQTAIQMRLAKIQAKTYDLQSHMFKTIDEVNELLNEICEFVHAKD